MKRELNKWTKTAKKSLVEHGEHTPLIIAEEKDGTKTMMSLIFGDSVEKEQIRNGAFQTMAKMDLKHYIMIMDSYMTTVDKNTGERIRREALIVQFYSAKKVMSNIIPYERDGKKIIFKKKDEQYTEGRTDFISYWDLWATAEVPTKEDALSKRK